MHLIDDAFPAPFTCCTCCTCFTCCCCCCPVEQVVRREVLERSTAELGAARSASDDARYELARHLNTVGGQR